MNRQRLSKWKKMGMVLTLMLTISAGSAVSQAAGLQQDTQAQETDAGFAGSEADRQDVSTDVSEAAEIPDPDVETEESGALKMADTGSEMEEQAEDAAQEDAQEMNSEEQTEEEQSVQEDSEGEQTKEDPSETGETAQEDSVTESDLSEEIQIDQPDDGVLEENPPETDPSSDQSGEESEIHPSQTPSVTPLSAGNSRLELTVLPDQTESKAGSTVTFDVFLKNTGDTKLTKIRLGNTLSREGIYADWIQTEGLTILNGQGAASLKLLSPGETRHLTLVLKIPEDQTSPLETLIKVTAGDPENENADIRCEQMLCTTVLPLKLDYQVKKTADRRAAVPGDTVTYEIEITNTGERTLHSVISTERFQLADVAAKFVKKAGILINEDCSQAYISKIEPGKTVKLEAVVQIPETVSAQKLVNQVFVTTKETGTGTMASEAAVQIVEPTPTVSPVPEDSGSETGGGAQSASTHPQTGDSSGTERYRGLLGASGFLLICLLLLRRRSLRCHACNH